MKSILEMFYNQPSGHTYGQDSPFVRNARIKCENLDLLYESMTAEQKELLEAYFDADAKINDMIYFEKFQYAFHLGAQLMQELTQGSERTLESPLV